MITRKHLRSIACATLLAATLHANSTMVFPSFALAARDEQKNFHPAVGIGNKFPLMNIDGKLVSSTTRYMQAKPTTAINDQFVEILSIKEVPNDNNLVLVVELKSSVALRDAFAVITYPRKDKDLTACKYSEIEEPLTGEVQKVRLRFSKNNMPENADWTLHFYHSGVELYDPSRSDLKEATPEQAFMLQLTRRVARTGNGDANPAPFFMPVTKPPGEMLPPGEDPVMVKVKFVITKSGKVNDYAFVDSMSDELQSHLSASIDQWLFFPRIKGGQLVEQTVTIPLKLR